MRKFVIKRTGTSLDSILAEGVEYTNGWCAVCWFSSDTQAPSFATYPSFEKLAAAHNGGPTSISVVNESAEDKEEEDRVLSMKVRKAKDSLIARSISRTVAAMDSEDIGVEVLQDEGLLMERDTYRTALERIRQDYGQVCEEFETCHHPACASSYASWETANAALGPHTRDPEDGFTAESGQAESAMEATLDFAAMYDRGALTRMSSSLSLAYRTLRTVANVLSQYSATHEDTIFLGLTSRVNEVADLIRPQDQPE